MLIFPFSLSGTPGIARKSFRSRMKASASARGFGRPRRCRSFRAIHLDTLTPAFAASTRTQASVASSMLMVTFFITRIS
jgi:hypothetical protein